MARAIHWDLSGKCGFGRNERWYDRVPESVLENDDYKLLWDFSVRTDHAIWARRPDLMIIDKRERSCQIIDVATPEDGREREKEHEKIEKYQDLARKSSKNVGREVKGDSGDSGSIGISTTEVEGHSEGH